MESKLPCTKSRCECDCVCVYVYGYQQKDSQRIPSTHCKKVENIKCGMNFVETLRGTLFRSAFPISLPLAVCVCYRRFRFCLFFAVSLSLFFSPQLRLSASTMLISSRTSSSQTYVRCLLIDSHICMCIIHNVFVLS